MSLKVLILEDSPDDASLLLNELKKTKFEIVPLVVDKEDAFKKELIAFNPDLVISDFFLSDFNGIKALRIVKEFNLELPFIMVTRSIDEETAVQCMKSGADDYITKGHYYRIPNAVSAAIDRKYDREERLIAIQKLNEKEEKFRELFNNMPIGFFQVSISGDIILVNPALLKMFGYDSLEDLQIDIHGYPHIYFRDLIAKGGKIQGAEFEWNKRNGNMFFVRVSSWGVFEKESISYYEGTVEDITVLKKSEAAFADNEKLYKVVFHQSVNGILLINYSTGAILDSNRAFQDIIGYGSEELHTLKITDLVEGYMHSEIAPGEAFDLTGNFYGDKYYKRKDGVLINVFVIASPLFYQDQQILCLIVRDVSKQKEIEAELQKSSYFLRHILDTLPNNVYIYKFDNQKMIYVNSNGSLVLGYKPDELLSMESCRLIIHPADQEFVDDQLCRLKSAENNEVFKREYRLKHKSGEYKWYIIHETVFVRKPSGEPEEILGVAADITDRKEILEQFRKEKEKAEKASKAKSDFLANISHEIRTPLNGVIGLAKLLSGTELNPKQKEYVDLIRSSSNNLFALINDILDLSKIESGKMKLHQDIVNIIELSSEAVKFFDIEAKKKNIDLSFEIDPVIDYNLMTDHTRLKQVVFNLLSNALKFTEKGFVKLKIKELSKSGENVFISVSVSDSGIGIEEEKIQILFDRFTQLNSSYSKKYQGSGLGLTIVKGIVGLFGGKILVESKISQGTVFNCEIPFLTTKRPTKSVEHLALPQLVKEGTRKNVLLAEDDFVNQLYIKTILKEHNVDVTVVPNGKEALEVLHKMKIDLILMDGQMPVMDGFETTKRIREMEINTKYHLPVIALTAYALKEEKQKCFDAGMDDFVSKPIDEFILLTTIEKHLNHNF